MGESHVAHVSLVVLVVGLAVVPGPRGNLDKGATPDPRWAGYETDSPVRAVAASWTEPAIAATAAGEAVVGSWVGLGGQDSPRLAQLGTAADAPAGQSPVYSAWYEMYPKPAYSLDPDTLAVHPGDQVSASVTEVASGRFRLAIINHTTHQRSATVQTDLAIPTTDAAIIAELPTGPRPLSLASFGSVQFTGCAVDGKPLNTVALTTFEIYRGGTSQARTTIPAAGGTSFTVSRQVTVARPSGTTAPTGGDGIQGLAGVVTPSGTPSPIPTTAETMSRAAYRPAVAHDRLLLLDDLARIARAGAGGTIDDVAFNHLSNDSQTAANDTEAAPAALAGLTARWNRVISLATLFGQPDSYMTRPAASVSWRRIGVAPVG